MGNNALWEKDKIIVFISKTQDVSVLLELGQSLWSSLTVYNYLTNYSYKLISQDLVLAQDPKILTKFIQKAQLRKNTKIFSLHPIICQKSEQTCWKKNGLRLGSKVKFPLKFL